MNIEAIVSEARTVINEATSISDLALKWANRVRPLIEGLPTVGPEATVVITALAEFDKALHVLQNALNAV